MACRAWSTAFGSFLLASLVTGCVVENSTAPGAEDKQIAASSEVDALIGRYGLKPPSAPSVAGQPEVRTFDRVGRLVSSRPLTPFERRQLSEVLRALRTGTGSGSLPSGGSGLSPGPATTPPSFVGFVDTTTTFEVANQLYTIEGATSGGINLSVITDPQDTLRVVGWTYFSQNGDTTTITAMVAQTYDEGYLDQEVYMPSEAIGELNDDIAEMAPPLPATYLLDSCWAAKLALFGAGLNLIRSGVMFWLAPTWMGLVDVVSATALYLAADVNYGCECKNKCAEEAPPSSVSSFRVETIAGRAWSGIESAARVSCHPVEHSLGRA